MKKSRILIVLLLFLFAFTLPAQADIAPPEQPPGTNIEPGVENTQVRMLSETVLIEVQKNTPANSLGQAKVSAEFVMENLGTASESMVVRFPASVNDGFYNYPEIGAFGAKVNGSSVATRKKTSDGDAPVSWVEFDAVFPAGDPVKIEVSYVLEGTGEYPYISFAYLLETGAGWQGTIGSAQVILRLPYDMNFQNVFIDSGPGWGDTTPGGVMEGRELRWKFADSEPTDFDNIRVALVMPSAWEKVLTEQANVARNSKDGEAWGRLGKIYKEISRLRRETRWDVGGMELFELSKEAYQNAITLLPDDALWHAGYAELLFDNYYWVEYSKSEKPGLLLALQELSKAVQLKPNEPFILDLVQEIELALPGAITAENGQVLFQWLTATPTFVPSLTETASPTLPPTATHTASSTAMAIPATQTSVPELPAASEVVQTTPTTVQPSASAKTLFPFCSGILVLPLAVILFSRRRK